MNIDQLYLLHHLIEAHHTFTLPNESTSRLLAQATPLLHQAALRQTVSPLPPSDKRIQRFGECLNQCSDSLAAHFRKTCYLKSLSEQAYFRKLKNLTLSQRQSYQRFNQAIIQRALKRKLRAVLKGPKFKLVAKNNSNIWRPRLSRILKNLVKQLLRSAKALPKPCKAPGNLSTNFFQASLLIRKDKAAYAKLIKLNLTLAERLQNSLKKSNFALRGLKRTAIKQFCQTEKRLSEPLPLACTILEIASWHVEFWIPIGLQPQDRRTLWEEARAHFGTQKISGFDAPKLETACFSVLLPEEKLIGCLDAVTLRWGDAWSVYVPALNAEQRRKLQMKLQLNAGSGCLLRFEEEARLTLGLELQDSADLFVVLVAVASSLRNNEKAQKAFEEQFSGSCNFKDLLRRGFIWIPEPAFRCSEQSAGTHFERLELCSFRVT